MSLNGDRSEEIVEVIRQYCEEDEIRYRQFDERTIHAGFQGKNFTYQMLARSREGHRQAIFLTIVPVKVQSEQRLAVAEFLCRANYGLILGNFEMDVIRERCVTKRAWMSRVENSPGGW
ncbi:MAG: YbjN domain-containing protein [Nitrospira sp.]